MEASLAITIEPRLVHQLDQADHDDMFLFCYRFSLIVTECVRGRRKGEERAGRVICSQHEGAPYMELSFVRGGGVLEPVVVWTDLPALQLAQPVDPGLGSKCPAAQLEQPVSPRPWYMPAAHAVKPAAPRKHV